MNYLAKFLIGSSVHYSKCLVVFAHSKRRLRESIYCSYQRLVKFQLSLNGSSVMHYLMRADGKLNVLADYQVHGLAIWSTLRNAILEGNITNKHILFRT